MAHGEIHVELAVNYADDPKVAALSRFGKDARSARDLYVQMLCYAKRNMTDGDVPNEVLGRLAYPDSKKIAEKHAGILADVKLIEKKSTGWHITAYLKRNRSKAQIIARGEALAAASSESGAYGNHLRWHVARDVAKLDCEFCTSGSDRVDPIGGDSGSRSLPHRSKTETETETETGRDRARRGARIPTDFAIDDEMREWCQARGIGKAQALRSTEAFVNYWTAKSGRDAAKLDWPATWRNWLIRDYPDAAADAYAGKTPGQLLNEQMGLA